MDVEGCAEERKEKGWNRRFFQTVGALPARIAREGDL